VNDHGTADGHGGRYGSDPGGPVCWTDHELVAFLLGVKAEAITDWPDWTGGLQGLAPMSEAQIAATLGLTKHRARKLMAVLEVHRRLQRARVPKRPSVNQPDLVVEVLAPHLLDDRERFWCLALDARCRLIGSPMEISSGDVDGTDAGPRHVMRAALRAGAVSVVVAHNHPTGDTSPSRSDYAVTSRLVAAGKAVDVPLVDHVVVAADGSWTSIRRERPDVFA